MYVFGAGATKVPDDTQFEPSILYSNVPEPPVGEAILIVPSLAPNQVSFVEVTVAESITGSVIV